MPKKNNRDKKNIMLLPASHYALLRVCHPHSNRMAGTAGLVFRQLFEKESSTYTYLLADAETKEVRDSAGPPPMAGVTAQSTSVKRR